MGHYVECPKCGYERGHDRSCPDHGDNFKLAVAVQKKDEKMGRSLSDEETAYRAHLRRVADGVAATVLKKDEEYGGSWKRRGGRGAYHNFARKWDRIENIVEGKFADDVFAAMAGKDGELSESLEDSVKDIVGYGLLLLAEMEARRARPKK